MKAENNWTVCWCGHCWT